MKKRNSREADDLFFAITMSLPWWVPFLLAGLAYGVLFRYSVFVALEWVGIFVFVGLILPFVKWKRNELLASATGLSAIRSMNWRDFELMVGEAFRVISGSFTRDALAEAEGQPLELIDGPKLLKLVQNVQAKATEIQQSTSNAESPVSTTLIAPNRMPTNDQPGEPLCPDCGRPMVRKQARKGPNAGNEFWGCPAYPQCRGTRRV